MKRASHNPVSMQNSELTIQCSNPHCAAFNDFSRRFCKRCRTPIVKRYLWAIGEKGSYSELGSDVESRKNFVSNNVELTKQDVIQAQTTSKPEVTTQPRYVSIDDRIFLDTQPGETPQIPDKIPEEIVNYLQLFAFFPYIPQIYGQLDGTQVWLLDYGTVPINREGKLLFPELLPTMTSLWSTATPEKQLNWLRQIAGLWQPLLEKGMATTLLNPDLIRVNSSFIQLIELESNGESVPSLQDLGKLWQQWSQQANSKIQEVLTQFCQRIASGAIDSIQQVQNILDRILELCSHSREYSYQIFALSDSGPTRSNNQDTAYPHFETPINNSETQQAIAIVCDGVGGHEGGEIASQETVNYLYERISAMPWDREQNTPTDVLKQLLKFTNEANDAISQRNDNEKRHERQRMGTTLVMTIARNHEVYLTHVGDSRIYLITSNSCHQLTTDDDLASREVRLGYAVYRDALQYPSAGALIQALGMRDSAALHPNSQRLIVDEDCLFLLCSDGLSDFDRVEQYWRDVIVPVLDDKSDITKAVQTLIKIGNECNGHDNVTAALVHCQVKPKSQVTETIITWCEVEKSLEDSTLPTNERISNPIMAEETTASSKITQKIPQQSRVTQKSSKSLLSGMAIAISTTFLIGLGILIYAYLNKEQEQEQYFQNEPQSQMINRVRLASLNYYVQKVLF